MSEEEELLTLEETAQILHVSTKKLRQWSRPGPNRVLRPIRLERITGPLKYKREDVYKLIEEHTINKESHESDLPQRRSPDAGSGPVSGLHGC